MKSKLELNLYFRRTALVAALTVASSAAAQTIPKEGNYDFSSCWSGVSNVVAFSKTHSALSYEMTGTSQSNPPGGLYDKTSFRCVGMNYGFDGKMTGTVVCESVDKDGDKSLTHFAIEGPNAKRTAISGTGKYEGMVSSGTSVTTGPFPVIKPGTFQNCNRQTGTYKLK
jgi:hypothetical protein